MRRPYVPLEEESPKRRRVDDSEGRKRGGDDDSNEDKGAKRRLGSVSQVLRILSSTHVKMTPEQVQKSIDELDKKALHDWKRDWKIKEIIIYRRAQLGNERMIVEAYSVPRVTKRAEEFGLQEGWSLDMNVLDENGKPWDLSDKSVQDRAE